jgi:hypothetical protein
VEGETTAVLSEVVALEEAAETLSRFCMRSQRLGSATIVKGSGTNCWKFAGACMTEGGASSESDRLRAGSVVSSLKG